MTQGRSAPAVNVSGAHERLLFWACFISLIATAFGFFTRFAVLPEWGRQYNLNPVQLGEIGGVGVWPFAISIILFSLVVDKIGYGTAMVFAFLSHVTYGVMVICAPLMMPGPEASAAALAEGQSNVYWMLYWGSFIFALGNGTVEAVINPVVATMFPRDKTKWLNILHAGWPAGLVLAGLMTIAMGEADWRYKIGLIFLPVAVYGVMMTLCKFPVNERVAAGTSYKTMLREFGVLAAVIVVGLIIRQIGVVFPEAGFVVGGTSLKLGDWYVQLGLGALLVVAFGAYTQSLGRPMLFFLMLIMIPLATTEIGTDGWITGLMEPTMRGLGYNAGWVLVYTSAIMMVLRFFAGPIVHRISPLGLLAISSVIAALGLTYLSTAQGVGILLAATLYGFGKTFFWPTMLGVVSEQCPKGGALTLNAVGGVGMLAVGVLGFPFIGLLQVNAVSTELAEEQPQLFEKVATVEQGILGEYEAVDPNKVEALTPLAVQAAKIRAQAEEALRAEAGKEPTKAALDAALADNAEYQALVDAEGYETQATMAGTITGISNEAKKGALAVMAIFPCIMLACYLALIAYFWSKGGYKPQVLTVHVPEDKTVATYPDDVEAARK